MSENSPKSPLRAFGRRFRDFQNRVRFRGAHIGPGTFIERGARIEPGVKLEARCAVFAGARLQGTTRIGEDSIIGRGVTIGGSSLGQRNVIEPRCSIYGSHLGAHTALQMDVELTSVRAAGWTYFARGARCDDVQFGPFCSIGPDCFLGAGEHPVDLLTTSPALYSTRAQCGSTLADRDSTFVERRPIQVGADVWLGARVFVRDGVSIGHGAIVAAGAIVARDVAPYAIVGGVPAKTIRYRFSPEIVTGLLSLAWWNWPEEKLRRAQPMLSEKDPLALLAWAESSAC